MTNARQSQPGAIWIDLDNAPQAVFFAPIIRALEERGLSVFLTARDVNHTPEIARQLGLDPLVVGHAFSKSRVAKISGTLMQGVKLARAARQAKPRMAVSHGSRGQAIAAWIRRIPKVVMFDYENIDLNAFRGVTKRYYYPQIIQEELDRAGESKLSIPGDKQRLYPGLKEHLLLLTETPDRGELQQAGIPADTPYAVIRPESDTAHYLDGVDDSCLLAALDQCDRWGLTAVLVPRSPKQTERLRALVSGRDNVVIPSRQVPGRTLLERARLLVSGGGTMNREAVVLGLPTVSIFRGKVGAIDRSMIRTGQMVHAPTADLVKQLAPPPASSAGAADAEKGQRVLDYIVDNLVADLQSTR